MPSESPLYHYTCAHVRGHLGRRAMLTPMPQPMLGGHRLLWLTELEHPNREGLGLTSSLLTCDRLEYRYTISKPVGVAVWTDWAARHVPVRIRMALEEGRAPDTWLVSEYANLGILDRSYCGPHDAE